MAKITEYEASTRLMSSDVMLTDGARGTEKISGTNLARSIPRLIGSYGNRNVYCGKNLGSTVTEEQKNYISAGTFDTMMIGDYWVINGVDWQIVDMDYFYQVGNPNFNTHHLVVIPRRPLYTAAFNDTATAEGGYVGSKLYTEGLTDALAMFNEAFPNMILPHYVLLNTSINANNEEVGIAYFERYIDLPTEEMIFGCKYVSKGLRSWPHFKQLAFSQYSSTGFYINRTNLWLANPSGSNTGRFCHINSYSQAADSPANGLRGIRPYACIGVQ